MCALLFNLPPRTRMWSACTDAEPCVSCGGAWSAIAPVDEGEARGEWPCGTSWGDCWSVIHADGPEVVTRDRVLKNSEMENITQGDGKENGILGTPKEELEPSSSCMLVEVALIREDQLLRAVMSVDEGPKLGTALLISLQSGPPTYVQDRAVHRTVLRLWPYIVWVCHCRVSPPLSSSSRLELQRCLAVNPAASVIGCRGAAIITFGTCVGAAAAVGSLFGSGLAKSCRRCRAAHVALVGFAVDAPAKRAFLILVPAVIASFVLQSRMRYQPPPPPLGPFYHKQQDDVNDDNVATSDNNDNNNMTRQLGWLPTTAAARARHRQQQDDDDDKDEDDNGATTQQYKIQQ
ncbi:hypothetical protein EDB86DRAFT_2838896 [Lactarius hatsudake]|nr:hypothetical protein EDB86DRAFT_2838896 [Lactarius hatsudake]